MMHFKWRNLKAEKPFKIIIIHQCAKMVCPGGFYKLLGHSSKRNELEKEWIRMNTLFVDHVKSNNKQNQQRKHGMMQSPVIGSMQ